MGHSVFQRLLGLARDRNEDFNLLLVRYGIERLLYRLSVSPYADRFILKGASLFLVWKGQNYRVTKDADLLGFGPADTNHVSAIFRELCQIPCESDGIRFSPETVKAEPIREEQEYGGIRVTLSGTLHHATIPLQIDIGFGDIVTPAPEEVTFPTLLEAPAPRLRAYSRYTMIAEKFETMVRLGIANSRMKDFHDIYLLVQMFDFDGRILATAIYKTFERRKTGLSISPTVFHDSFAGDSSKETQWRAFIRKASPDRVPASLLETITFIKSFLGPVVTAIVRKESFEKTWKAPGPWA